MQLSETYNSIKEHIILWYNMLIDYFKKLTSNKSKINNQNADQDIHIIKYKVKHVKIKKKNEN
jgi:hypothetical protein